jgi:hypothetical protein
MTSDPTERFIAMTRAREHLLADGMTPGALEAPAPAYAAFVPQEGRLQRWARDLLRERLGVDAKALAAGGALLGSSFAPRLGAGGWSGDCAPAYLVNRPARLLAVRLARGGLSMLTLLFAAIGTAVRAAARWREAVKSAALIAAAGTICVFALFARPERTYAILPDSTPDAAPPPASTQPAPLTNARDFGTWPPARALPRGRGRSRHQSRSRSACPPDTAASRRKARSRRP